MTVLLSILAVALCTWPAPACCAARPHSMSVLQASWATSLLRASVPRTTLEVELLRLGRCGTFFPMAECTACSNSSEQLTQLMPASASLTCKPNNLPQHCDKHLSTTDHQSIYTAGMECGSGCPKRTARWFWLRRSASQVARISTRGKVTQELDHASGCHVDAVWPLLDWKARAERARLYLHGNLLHFVDESLGTSP